MAHGDGDSHEDGGQAGDGDEGQIDGGGGVNAGQEGQQAAGDADEHGPDRHSVEVGLGQRGRVPSRARDQTIREQT